MIRAFLAGFLRYIWLPFSFVTVLFLLSDGSLLSKVGALAGGIAITFFAYVVIWRVTLKRERGDSAREAARRALRGASDRPNAGEGSSEVMIAKRQTGALHGRSSGDNRAF